MALHRRILTSDLTDGPDCSYATTQCLLHLSPPPPLPHANRRLANLFIAAGCLIAAAFFLALTYYAVFKRRRRRRRLPPIFAFSDGHSNELLDGGGGGDHHIWQIRTVGLDEDTIGSIAVFEYAANEGGGGVLGADCSVCLSEFADGELVRLLPKCTHAFHVSCIDMWLRGHVNCPLCRAPVMAATADADAGSAEVGGGVVVAHSVEEDFSSLDVRGNSQTSVEELNSDRGMSWEGEGESDRTDGVAVYSSVASSPMPVPSGLEEGGPDPVRRSVSLVEFPQGSFREEEEQKEAIFVGENSSKSGGKQGSSSKEVEKSLSGSGRGFFFLKNGRSRSMVLPL